MQNVKMHIQEGQQTLRKINSKRSPSMHCYSQTDKRQRESEATKEKRLIHKESSIRLTVLFIRNDESQKAVECHNQSAKR